MAAQFIDMTPERVQQLATLRGYRRQPTQREALIGRRQ